MVNMVKQIAAKAQSRLDAKLEEQVLRQRLSITDLESDERPALKTKLQSKSVGRVSQTRPSRSFPRKAPNRELVRQISLGSVTPATPPDTISCVGRFSFGSTVKGCDASPSVLFLEQLWGLTWE